MPFKGFKTQTRFKSTCHKSRDDAQENAEESIGEISNIFMAHVIFLNCKYSDIWCVGISYLFGMDKTKTRVRSRNTYYRFYKHIDVIKIPSCIKFSVT